MSDWGKRVWIVIFIKLFIMFAVLRIFFFHDFLNDRYANDKQRSEYVLEQLTKSTNTND
jgi:ABC-type dipeptide/oligopeptide/nickel transport system permease subunit